MASVKKIGKKYCVIHSTSGAVITRGGRKACYTTRPKAQGDANKTACRVKGTCRR